MSSSMTSPIRDPPKDVSLIPTCIAGYRLNSWVCGRTMAFEISSWHKEEFHHVQDSVSRTGIRGTTIIRSRKSDLQTSSTRPTHSNSPAGRNRARDQAERAISESYVFYNITSRASLNETLYTTSRGGPYTTSSVQPLPKGYRFIKFILRLYSLIPLLTQPVQVK